MTKAFRLSLLVLLGVLAFSLPAAAQDSVTITFAHIFGGENDSRVQIVQEIANDFMAQHPNVTIELQSPSTDYTELFNSALLAAEQNNAPTIVQIEDASTQLAADSTYFLPISQIASADQLASMDDMLDTVVAYYTIGSTIYSVPWNASNPVLYYNKAMFTVAGLDPNTPPTTFSEISADCDAIMAKQADLKIAGCLNFPMASWFFEEWMAMQNAQMVNNDNGRSARATEVNFTSDSMLNIVNWLKGMAANKSFVYDGKTDDYYGEATTFLGGGTAMTINSTAGITLFQNFAMAQGLDLGIAALPMPNEGATNGVTVGGASLWVSGGHSDAETQAAVDFIFFLTDTENDIKWHKGSGYFPIRQSSIDQLTAEGWFDQNPSYTIAIHQLQASAGNVANAGAVMGPASDVRRILVQGVQSVIDGDADPYDAMAAAKSQADIALAQYNNILSQ